VISLSSSLDGLHSAEVRFDAAAKRIAAAPAGDSDPAGDTVALMESKTSFEANLKAISVSDEMTKTTLNLLA